MTRRRYKLNAENLNFEIVKIPMKNRLKRLLFMFFASIILSVVYMKIYSCYFDTPKIALLRQKTDELKLKCNILFKEISKANNVVTEISQRDKNVYRAIFGLQPNASLNVEKKERDNIVSGEIGKISAELNAFRFNVYTQSKSFDEVSGLAFDMEKMALSVPAVPPIDLSKVKISSQFGVRQNPIFGYFQMHTGIDFSGPIGTKIHSTGNGTVIRTEYSFSGYGNVVDVDHGFGYVTRYAHLSRILVRKGIKVKRGDLIGLSGNTGFSSGPHLHYEVRYMDKPVNPRNFFITEQNDFDYKLMENNL